MKKLYTLLGISAMLFSGNLSAQYCTPPSFLSGPFTGIINVNFAGINNTTSGTVGYADYTSGSSASVVQGSSYPISIEVEHTLINSGFTDNVDLRVWIDWNSDGDFNDAGEEVVSQLVDVSGSGSSNTAIYSGNITVPAGATVGSTRMRVYEDMLVADGHLTPTPCGYSSGIGQHGESEDYTVVISASSGSAPTADFIADQTNVIEGTVVNFTDLSSNSPTSWAWTITPGSGWGYFGGTTASSQNPQVMFSLAGTYTVELTATNTNGSDVETKTDYITVTTGIGLDENEAISNMSIYPNPTSDYCNIQFSLNNSDNTNISVYNLLGELVFEMNSIFNAGANTVPLNTNLFNQGIYIINISTSEGKISKQLTVL